MLLTVEALQTFYGKSHVLRDVSFTVPARPPRCARSWG